MTDKERKMLEKIENNEEAFKLLNKLWKINAWSFSEIVTTVYNEYFEQEEGNT